MDSKSMIIIASALIVFMLVSGCVDNTVVTDGTGGDSGAGTGGDSDILDCGEQPIYDYELDSCIEGAFKDCTPAKIVGDSTGGGTTLTIEGLTGDLCAIEYAVLFEANPAKGVYEDRTTYARCDYPASVYETGEFPDDADVINAHCYDVE